MSDVMYEPSVISSPVQPPHLPGMLPVKEVQRGLKMTRMPTVKTLRVPGARANRGAGANAALLKARVAKKPIMMTSLVKAARRSNGMEVRRGTTVSTPSQPKGKPGVSTLGAIGKGIGGTAGAVGSSLNTDNSGAAAGTGGNLDLQSILSQLGLGGGSLQALLKQMGGQPISLANKAGQPTQIGQLLTQMTTPYDLNTANTMAADEFSPLIKATQVQQQMQTAQAAQNQADIQNWYQQVVNAANSAIAGDSKASAGAAASDQAIASGLASSIGGSANPAAANVATAGANDAAFTNAITSSQAQYDNLIPALLKSDQAATSQRETGLQQQQQLALAMQLAGYQSQQAQTADQLRMQMQQANQQMDASKLQTLMGIKQYNSGLASSKASNALNTKLALAQMAEAAPSLGLKSELTQAQIQHELGTTPGQIQTQRIARAKAQQAQGNYLINAAKAKGTLALDQARLKYYGFQEAKIKNGILTAMAGGKPVKLNMANGIKYAGTLAGADGQGRLPKGGANLGKLANAIGGWLVSQGLRKGSQQYYTVGHSLMAAFYTSDGKAIIQDPKWFK